jgi:hypothetical protein
MIKFDLTNAELFVPKLDFKFAGENIDLYNYYNCSSIDINDIDLIFTFHLDINCANYLVNTVRIIFSDFIFATSRFPLMEIDKSKTIVNLQRAKFEYEGKLHEKDKFGRNYFLIEFSEDHSIEVFAKSVIIEGIIHN